MKPNKHSVLALALAGIILAVISTGNAYAYTFTTKDSSLIDQYYIWWDETVSDVPHASYQSWVTWQNTLENLDPTHSYYAYVYWRYNGQDYSSSAPSIMGYGQSRDVEGKVQDAYYGTNTITQIQHYYKTENGGGSAGLGYLTHSFNVP